MNAPVTLFSEGSTDKNPSELVSLAFELARDLNIVTSIGEQGKFQIQTTMSLVDNGIAYESCVSANGQTIELENELQPARHMKKVGHGKRMISRVAIEAARLHLQRRELVQSQQENIN